MLVWMAVVFTLSSDFASAEHTGRIIEPILRWIDPSISPLALARAHFVIRKCAHVTEYAILALLILRGLRNWRGVAVTHWSWTLAFAALCGSAAYAATDEFHQTFVPSRGPSVHDVGIDAAGAAFGLMLAFGLVLVHRRRRALVAAS